MLSVLRRRPEFARLWAGEVVSMLGDWLTYVAVSLLALEHGEGWLAVAFVLVAHSLPSALFAPIAGYLVDRFDRRRVLVLAALARGVLTLGMVAAAVSGCLWAVQLLLLVRVGLSAFAESATLAALPRLVREPADIAPANALMAATWSVMFAAGVGLGGLLVAFAGPELAIGIDALTFFGAALIAAGLPALPTEARRGKSSLGDALGDLHEAFAHAMARRPLLGAVLGKLPAAIANGGAWVWLNLRAPELGWLGTTALTLGLLQSVRAVGTGVGPLLWARVDRRVSAGGLSAATCLVFAGVALFAAVPNDSLLLGVAVLLWGMGSGANWVAATTRIQLLGPDRLLGRLSAADLLGHMLGQCAGALAGALVATWTGHAEWSAWTGCGLGLGAWLLLELLRRQGSSSPEPARAVGG